MITITGGQVSAGQISSAGAVDGQVATADGAGGVAWEELPAAGGGILATGATVGATSQRQVFTNGIVGPSWKPAADSVTALQLQNAAGTNVLNVDTTNSRVGIGTASPGTRLTVISPGEVSSISDVQAGAAIFFKGTTLGVAMGVDGASNRPLLQSVSSQIAYSLSLNPYGGNVGIGVTAPTAALHLPASTTARASLRIPAGAAPTIPNAGDVWCEGSVLKFFNGTITKEIAFV